MPDSLLREMHKTIKRITADIENLSFNTAISSLMVFGNSISSAFPGSSTKPRQALETLVLLLSPFAPHVAEELWQQLGHKESLAHHPWPQHIEKWCEDTVVTIAIQVNGKLRGEMEIPRETVQEDALRTALDQVVVKKYVEGKEIKKTVYVPGRILNILV
jgi:leucyl-tRNA synthetase